MSRIKVTVDGNEAAAYVAHKTNEVIAIYPITPSSPMGEFSDQWSSDGQPNIWGSVPHVMEMQSEGGAVASPARSPAGRQPGDHLHLVPGPVADDSQHVQDRRRAHPVRHSCSRALHRRPGTVHLRRPPGRHGRAPDRLGAAGLQQCAGSHGHRPHRAGRNPRIARSLRAFLRRLPHLARGRQGRAAYPGRYARHAARGIRPPAPRCARSRRTVPCCAAPRRIPDVYFQARETVNPYYLAVPTILQKAMDRFAASRRTPVQAL